MTDPKLTAAHYSDQWKAAKFDEVVGALREMVNACPGGAEYGRGFNRTIVHGSCCGKSRVLLAEIDRSKP